jgi:acyl-CoA synthetase (AMP-forming)/AMP-acid ligase II
VYVDLQTVLDDIRDLPLYQYTSGNTDKVLHSNVVDLLPALASSPSHPLSEDLCEGSCSDKVLYIFTSGTTGLPKAAVITHLRYVHPSVIFIDLTCLIGGVVASFNLISLKVYFGIHNIPRYVNCNFTSLSM